MDIEIAFEMSQLHPCQLSATASMCRKASKREHWHRGACSICRNQPYKDSNERSTPAERLAVSLVTELEVCIASKVRAFRACTSSFSPLSSLSVKFLLQGQQMHSYNAARPQAADSIDRAIATAIALAVIELRSAHLSIVLKNFNPAAHLLESLAVPFGACAKS